ncbi:MAG: homoserine kinase [Clostridia bacterium]|nr:homoserine kinase [Clostridia bacterium]
MIVRIKVPATSANMGPGFDCLGVALGLYNVIETAETGGGLSITAAGSKGFITGNENNLIYRAMMTVFEECGYTPKGIRIFQRSRIPMTRGLGSSSACIIGGMLGANVIAGRQLSYDRILELACKMEGHPDNVTPALYGGFCTAVREGERVYHTSTKLSGHIKFAVMIPGYYVATKRSRTVVPDSFSKADAVFNISHAAMLVSALTSGKTELLRIACEDRMHQQYRKEYIEGMEDIFRKSYELGACAVYLSGSGPTILSVLDKNYSGFADGMNRFFKESFKDWKCRILTIDNVGSVVSERP